MLSLRDFQVPNESEVAVCEIDGKVQYMNYEYANVSTFTNSVENYPTIQIKAEQLYESNDENVAVFLPTDTTFINELYRVYYERGFTEAINLLKSHPNLAISHSADLLLNFLNSVENISQLLTQNVQENPLDLIKKLTQARDWTNSTIRFISWHPHCNKLAIVTCDDCVRIYSNTDEHVCLLTCKQQKNVTCIAWRPFSNTEIAIGHENGIIVWNVDSNKLAIKPSVTNAIILERNEHRPVLSIAWSLNGDKLVSVAGSDRTILIWNCELKQTSELKRPGGSGHVLVKWSPTGEKLFTSSNGLVFRVWDCRNWECERWTVPNGRVQSACWVLNGSCLVFATTTESIIYGVVIKNEIIFTNDTDSSANQAVPIFDLTKIDVNGMLVGGLIQCIESDTKGNHIAVLFQDTDAVAVFVVIRQPILNFIPSALIMGSSGEKPTAICFKQKFDNGACLTIGWSSGRIQYYPIIYNPVETNSVQDPSAYISLYRYYNTKES